MAVKIFITILLRHFIFMANSFRFSVHGKTVKTSCNCKPQLRTADTRGEMQTADYRLKSKGKIKTADYRIQT